MKSVLTTATMFRKSWMNCGNSLAAVEGVAFLPVMVLAVVMERRDLRGRKVLRGLPVPKVSKAHRVQKVIPAPLGKTD
jgi:hypothetical protein